MVVLFVVVVVVVVVVVRLCDNYTGQCLVAWFSSMHLVNI